MGTNLKDKNGNNIYPIIKNTDIQTSEGVAFNPQEKLPNASASGKVLTSTNSTGGFEWADPTGGGGTSNFNSLTNRPSYNSVVMTNETNIPEVKTATWDAKSVVSGTNDGTNWQTITIDGTTKNIPSGGSGGSSTWGSITGTLSNQTDLQSALDAKSVVSGTNDGSNWTTLTVNGTTKAIPAGGGQSTVDIPMKVSTQMDSKYCPNTQFLYNESDGYYYAFFSKSYGEDQTKTYTTKRSLDLEVWETINNNYTLPNYIGQVLVSGNIILLILSTSSSQFEYVSNTSLYKGEFSYSLFEDPSNLTQFTLTLPEGRTLSETSQWYPCVIDNKFIFPLYNGTAYKPYFIYSSDLATFTTIDLDLGSNNEKYFQLGSIVKIGNNYIWSCTLYSNNNYGFYKSTGSSLDSWEWVNFSSLSLSNTYLRGFFSNVENNTAWIFSYNYVFKFTYTDTLSIERYNYSTSGTKYIQTNNIGCKPYLKNNYLYFITTSNDYGPYGLFRIHTNDLLNSSSQVLISDSNDKIEFIYRTFNKNTTTNYIYFTEIPNKPNNFLYVNNYSPRKTYGCVISHAIINTKTIQSFINDATAYNAIDSKCYISNITKENVLELGRVSGEGYMNIRNTKRISGIGVNDISTLYTFYDKEALSFDAKGSLKKNNSYASTTSVDQYFSRNTSMFEFNNKVYSVSILNKTIYEFTGAIPFSSLTSANFTLSGTLPIPDSISSLTDYYGFDAFDDSGTIYIIIQHADNSYNLNYSVLKSTDAVTWTFIYTLNTGTRYGSGCQLNKIGNNIYAYCLNKVYLVESSQLTEITAISNILSNYSQYSLRGLSYANGKYFLFINKYGYDSKMFVSDDLLTFTEATVFNQYYSPSFVSPKVGYRDGVYYVFGYCAPNQENSYSYAYSSDAVNWTSVKYSEGTTPVGIIRDHKNNLIYFVSSKNNTAYYYTIIDYNLCKFKIGNTLLESHSNSVLPQILFTDRNALIIKNYVNIKNASGNLYWNEISNTGRIGTAGINTTDAIREIIDVNYPKTVGAAVSSSNKFIFNVGTDVNGMYVFSFGNTMTNLFMYNLTNGTTYKTTGTFVYDSMGSVITTTLNYKLNGTNLEIWSGNSNFNIVNGFTGYLFKVKLY